MHANIQKNSGLSVEQKLAQCQLIDTMSLNTLLTGLEPRLGQIIRASNPRDILEAQVRIRRELQLSYFENQKMNKPPARPHQPVKRAPFQTPKCLKCGKIGHVANNCHSQPQRPNYSFNNNNQNFQRQFSPQNFQQNPNQFRPTVPTPPPVQNQQRPNYPQQNIPQNRPSVIQRNPNHRAHYVDFEDNQYEFDYPNFDNQYDDDYNYDYYQNNQDQQPYYYDDNCDYNDYQTPPTQSVNANPNPYQDFLALPTQDNPPGNKVQSNQPDNLQQIQSQIRTLNLNDNQKFREQAFL